MIPITRRQVLQSIPYLLALSRCDFVQSTEDPNSKPPVLFIFDTENFELSLKQNELTEKNLDAVRENLDETHANYKDFEIPAYLTYRVTKFNWPLRDKAKRLHLLPRDEREKNPPLKLKQEESPEIVRESNALVKFKFPLKFGFDDQMDVDIDNITLRKYTDPRDGEDKDGIVIPYTIPNKNNPTGERLVRFKVVPADIETIVMKSGLAFYINVKKAFKAQQ